MYGMSQRKSRNLSLPKGAGRMPIQDSFVLSLSMKLMEKLKSQNIMYEMPERWYVDLMVNKLWFNAQ